MSAHTPASSVRGYCFRGGCRRIGPNGNGSRVLVNRGGNINNRRRPVRGYCFNCGGVITPGGRISNAFTVNVINADGTRHNAPVVGYAFLDGRMDCIRGSVDRIATTHNMVVSSGSSKGALRTTAVTGYAFLNPDSSVTSVTRCNA